MLKTIVFTKNSGSHKKGLERSFEGALADFFVNKLKVAEHKVNVEQPTFDDFIKPSVIDPCSVKVVVPFAEQTNAVDEIVVTPKKRGRKPKVKSEEDIEEVKVPKKRGRKPKNKTEDG